jgi:anaerobic ribonucleoside-triphosphate reductase
MERPFEVRFKEERESRNFEWSATIEREPFQSYIYKTIAEKARKKPEEFVNQKEFLKKFLAYTLRLKEEERKFDKKDVEAIKEYKGSLNKISQYANTWLQPGEGLLQKLQDIFTIMNLIDHGESLPWEEDL